MPITIFLIEPSGKIRRRMRRYAVEDGCPLTARADGGALVATYHQASTAIGDLREVRTKSGSLAVPPAWPDNDHRWPTHCACGYAFTDEDARQIFDDPLYVNRATGLEYVLRDAPPGALWDAHWLRNAKAYRQRSPDGRVLTLKLPDGTEWVIDGPANNGHGWTRTGTPPRLTVTPSILTPSFHGWLSRGELGDDLEGRSYPQRAS